MPTLRRQGPGSRQPASTSSDGALTVLSSARGLPSRSALVKWAPGARKKNDAAAATEARVEDKENRRTAQQPETFLAARRPGRGRDKLSVPRAGAQDLLPRSAHSVRDSLSELLRASSRQGLGDSGSGGVTEELPAVCTSNDFGWAWEDNPLGREGKWRRVSFTSRRLSFDAPLARLSLSCSEADAPGGHAETKGSVWPGRFSLGSSSPRRVGKLVSLVKSAGGYSPVRPHSLSLGRRRQSASHGSANSAANAPFAPPRFLRAALLPRSRALDPTRLSACGRPRI